ncbi:hypothetical protein CYG48_16210 [Neorhizobium sp. SOG26]|uniref:Uncharacterized protein n=1 Tax=Neorhizobium turbinariae TaxID=2937795 RepID=A0ABT0IW45_9HYPH|nr:MULTISPECIES: hypothetical protein [Neorhizobium]AXV17097.1 hypothetical protein CYG48_16210 [Neorhizobium sp. SOG26]MCK8782093.1 hypothetical protein [Neorhizobium turbinariae]
MLKGAWILPAVMVVALILAALVPGHLFAADRGTVDWARPTPAANPAPAFKDLPGVVPEEQRVAKDSYDCTSDIEDVYIARGRYDILYGDTLPRRVYRCKTPSGVTYTGTRLPNTHWVPGLNPHHLPK